MRKSYAEIHAEIHAQIHAEVHGEIPAEVQAGLASSSPAVMNTERVNLTRVRVHSCARSHTAVCLSLSHFGKVMCMIMPFLVKLLVSRIFSERLFAQQKEAMFSHANSSASLINVGLCTFCRIDVSLCRHILLLHKGRVRVFHPNGRRQ